MRRAINDLCQLPDAKLFGVVAEGIGHIMVVVDRLEAVASKLAKAGDHHASRIIRNQTEEEAAKVLILVDAVRCPPERKNEKSRVLKYFYNHLAKGIYAKVTEYSNPEDFAWIQGRVEQERAEHYLDGPQDVDWIMPNDIIQRREDELYVGYVCDDTEDPEDQEWLWTCPSDGELTPYATPRDVVVARALQRVGATTPKGLELVAKIWRAVDVRPNMTLQERNDLNAQTLKALDDRELLVEGQDGACAEVYRYWPFPLWPLDLQEQKVKKKDLREVRKNWVPDY